MRRVAILSVIVLMLMASACASWDENAYLQDGYDAMTQERYSEAERYFNKVVEINPNNAYALLNLGVVYQNTERYDQAKEMYRKVIALDPKEKPSEVTREDARGKPLADIARENLEILQYME